MLNIDNGCKLGLNGNGNVRYADFLCGGATIMLMVRLTGGKHACIKLPVIVFKNESRSHPIRGAPDNVPGVCYGLSPKG